MKGSHVLALLVLLAIPVAACNRGAEEPEEATTEQETVMVVADSTILRDLNARLDIDPRFDSPEIELEAHVQEGEVTLIGVVPSRYELSIAVEVARSTPGVREVWGDSVRVLSEATEGAETQTTTEQT